MKNLILILALLWSVSTSLHAQYTDEQLAEELERMEQQMQQFMEQLGWGSTGNSIRIDTLFFNGEGLMDFPPDQLLSSEMMELMEQQMQQFFNGQHMEIDSLFKSFSLPELVVPDPKDQPKKKKGKKRKVYTL